MNMIDLRPGRALGTVIPVVVSASVLLVAGCTSAPAPSRSAETQPAQTVDVEATHAAQSATAAQATMQAAGLVIAIGETIPGDACGAGPAREASNVDDIAIGRVIGQELAYMTTPYAKARYTVLTNDGTFARVLVCLQMRKTPSENWREYVADRSLAKVGGAWRVNGFSSLGSSLQPAEDWKKREASTTAAAKIHAEVIHVEARERPKDRFGGGGGQDYLATVRWSTDDHAQHLVQYRLWFAVDGHNCVPYASFTPQTTPPKDVERHMALAWPLAADGSLDLQASFDQIMVAADHVEKAYGLQPTMLNKEEVECSSMDNPHGQQLQIEAVDGTQLSQPLDTPATPPAFPSH